MCLGSESERIKSRRRRRGERISATAATLTVSLACKIAKSPNCTRNAKRGEGKKKKNDKWLPASHRATPFPFFPERFAYAICLRAAALFDLAERGSQPEGVELGLLVLGSFFN